MFRRSLSLVELVKASAKSRLQLNNYNCWSCHRLLTDKEAKQLFCPCECKYILPVNKNVNYFELFNLDTNYAVNKTKLTNKFRELMRKIHPDLFTLKTEKEKQYSADHASQLNKAYHTLMNPIERGLYMLELKNIDYEKESYTMINPECKKPILMEVLELNELIDEITDSKEVEKLEEKLYNTMRPFKIQLENEFAANNNEEAIRIIIKMKYYQNVFERLADLKLKFNLTES